MPFVFGAIVLVAAFIALAVTLGYREDKRNIEKWNDGNCWCSTGSWRFEQDKGNEIYIYRCTSCEDTMHTTRRMDA